MHRFVLQALVALVCMSFVSCQNTQKDAWDAFTACGTTACVEEVLAVKDAFLKAPKAILTRFNETDEKGEDHVVGWLYILRDSVLVNSNYASVEERVELQKQIVETAQAYKNDIKFQDMVNFIISEIGNLVLDPAIVEGTWESLTDPKSVVKIDDTNYTDEYDGKDLYTVTYSFYSICPEDCNPIGLGACLKTFNGEEEVCFAIVSATEHNLELSQIGGTGNTNRYKRVQ